MISEYFKEDDIMCISSNKKIKHSRELKGVDILIDFDKEDNIVGIEISDFMEAIKESQKKINRIFASQDNDGGGK